MFKFNKLILYYTRTKKFKNIIIFYFLLYFPPMEPNMRKSFSLAFVFPFACSFWVPNKASVIRKEGRNEGLPLTPPRLQDDLRGT